MYVSYIIEHNGDDEPRDWLLCFGVGHIFWLKQLLYGFFSV